MKTCSLGHLLWTQLDTWTRLVAQTLAALGTCHDEADDHDHDERNDLRQRPPVPTPALPLESSSSYSFASGLVIVIFLVLCAVVL